MTQPPSPLTMLFSRHTRRREFITRVGGAAERPLPTSVQQPAIGILLNREVEPAAYGEPMFL
jgi:hypothetical protein